MILAEGSDGGGRKSDCDRLKDLKYRIDESRKLELEEALSKTENLSGLVCVTLGWWNRWAGRGRFLVQIKCMHAKLLSLLAVLFASFLKVERSAREISFVNAY